LKEIDKLEDEIQLPKDRAR